MLMRFAGVNYVETEETSTGEEYLLKCLEKMEDYKLTKDGMGIYQNALNQMGILLTGRRRAQEALDYFKQAELLYVDFKSVVGGAPCTVDEYLSPPTDDEGKLEYDRSVKFESEYTHTLFYFAQVYQLLGEPVISGQYCHLTLQRQLDAPGLNNLDWSLQAATLSQYYMTERDFPMSRHCLASAEVMYAIGEANDATNCPDEEKEKLSQAKADIIRCWVKYGLGLLEFSREKLLEEAADQAKSQEDGEKEKSEIKSTETTEEVTETRDTDSSASSKKSETEQDKESVEADEASANVENSIAESGDNSLKNEDTNENNENKEPENQEDEQDNNADMKKNKDDPEKIAEMKRLQREENYRRSDELRNETFKKGGKRFNLEVTSHEEKVGDQPLKTFDEAREIFLMIKKWIEQAKEFYKFEHHCSDYISIVQDHSLSFKLLAFFELDMERQCKMHKRRIDMLTEILNELNPQHYLLVCRQLMFEVADTYSTMMDLKIAILESSGEGVRPTPHHVKKINVLVSESIKYYQEYLNTLKDGKPVYPDQFPSNDIRAGLVAMFCMGRLFGKFLAGDVQTRLLNMKKSKDCYQFVVDYCKRNPSAVPLVATELEICQEMTELLPAKMERVRLQAEM